MFDPPGRSTAWMYGFNTAPNYDHNQVGCGRAFREECGVCGDPLNQYPGANTLGGKYGTGKIVKTYKIGQVLKAKVRVTTNHAGFFEFSLCRIRGGIRSTEKCFRPLISLQVDRRPKDFDQSETKWELLQSDGQKDFEVTLQLPTGFMCSHCVLRWIWNSGNDHGCGENGKCELGFGPMQEKFYSCADIAITKSGLQPVTKPPRVTTTPRPVTTTTEDEFDIQKLYAQYGFMDYVRSTSATTTTSTTTETPTSTTTTTTTTTPTTEEEDEFDIQKLYAKYGFVDDVVSSKTTTSIEDEFDIQKLYAKYGFVDDVGSSKTATPIGNSTRTIAEADKLADCAIGLPDPENCCGYLRCIWSNSRHEQETSLERVPCANGTAWNVDKKYCDHFFNVDCGNRDDTCTMQDSTGPWTNNISELDEEIQEEPNTAPLITNRCSGMSDQAEIPDPEDCCGYIICMWPNTLWEREQKMHCPPKTSWDPNLGICNTKNQTCICDVKKEVENIDKNEDMGEGVVDKNNDEVKYKDEDEDEKKPHKDEDEGKDKLKNIRGQQ